jgi:hypothetical protein
MSAGSATHALAAISSDLAVAISFRLSSELMKADRGSDVASEEVVSVLLGFAVLLVCASAMVSSIKERQGSAVSKEDADGPQRRGVEERGEGGDAAARAGVSEGASRGVSPSRSMLDFLSFMLSIVLRITFSTLVQVLAAAASEDTASSRLARILTLASLSIYFVWIGSASQIRLT